MAYKLKIGTGSAATFAALGITAAQLECDAEARSSLTLETAAALGSAPIIAPFQRVLLYDSADTVRFAGWLDEAPRSARGESHRVTYRLSGPHRWIARANFVQSRGGLVILGGTAGSESTAPVAFNAAVTSVLDTALASYSGAFAYAGQNTFTHQIPARLRADVDCLTALLSLVAFAPSAVFWWTYDSSGNPTLNLGNGIGSADKTLSTATHAISAAEVNPRYDLLADVVKVYFVSGNVVSSEQTATSAGDAAALGANRTVLFSYDTTVLNNIPSAGIAAALADWHQTLHIDASATRHDVDWTDRPGHIYAFSGTDLAQFTGYKSILHTISRDLFSETTSLELGVIPGKTLFKVNDLDQSGGNTVTHAAAPAFSPSQVSSLSSLQDSLGAGQLSLSSGSGEINLDAAQTGGRQVSLREIQNCDGLKALVMMSAWYT